VDLPLPLTVAMENFLMVSFVRFGCSLSIPRH
jgi:hypothetical protein